MLHSNHGMCFNWNALVAAAETTNKLSLRMKTALFTNLQYYGRTLVQYAAILPSHPSNDIYINICGEKHLLQEYFSKKISINGKKVTNLNAS